MMMKSDGENWVVGVNWGISSNEVIVVGCCRGDYGIGGGEFY
jgi:hypothetical protein